MKVADAIELLKIVLEQNGNIELGSVETHDGKLVISFNKIFKLIEMREEKKHISKVVCVMIDRYQKLEDKDEPGVNGSH